MSGYETPHRTLVVYEDVGMTAQIALTEFHPFFNSKSSFRVTTDLRSSSKSE
jgi:hypothetical protein